MTTAKRAMVESRTRSSAPEPTTINAAQEQLWTETRAAFLSQCPAFAHILYSMMNPRNEAATVAYWTHEVPIAATDGVQLLLNPDTFFEYPLKERVFAVAHEVLHCVYNHCGLLHLWHRQGYIMYTNGTKLPLIPDLMNYAMDYVINDLLIEAKVGRFNTDWLHDKTKGTSTDSVVDVYKKLFNEMPPSSKPKIGKMPGGGMGPVDGDGQPFEMDPGDLPNGKRFDEHLKPGTSQNKSEEQAKSERSEIEWKTAVAAAISAARVQGKLPGALERAFGEVLEPAVDWTDKIQSFFARRVGGGGYNFRRADRRLITRQPKAIFAPSRSGFGCGLVCLGADTSGSINGPILDRFFAEIAGIMEDLRPEKIMIFWCDAKVHRVDVVEDAEDINVIRCKGAPGGGGTSFVPVFDKIAELHLEPDALVYLTDGYGSFPDHEPDYPVLWGDITDRPDAYPFGEHVAVPN